MTVLKAVQTKVALVLLGTIVAVAGCNRASHSDPIGQLAMELTLPDGSDILAVDYAITGNSQNITGTIPVALAGNSVSVLVGGVPEGMGYTVTLTAQTTDTLSNCEGSNGFDVIAGQTTDVAVAMHCVKKLDSGNVLVNGTLNQCPTIDAFSVQPLQTEVGGMIVLTSSASDPEMGALTYMWSATGGSFVNVASQNTDYTCTLAGNQTLKLTVDDGNGCTVEQSIAVNCISQAVCGNGIVEPGEPCDDGNTVNTDACTQTGAACPGTAPDCLCRAASCGDGFVQASVEQCDPADPATGAICEPDCTIRAGCGNGQLDPGEQCDPTNLIAMGMTQVNCDADNCSASCQIEECGNGVLECAEVCDQSAGDVPFGSQCACAPDSTSCTAAQCLTTELTPCRTCEEANCRNFQGIGIDLVAGCFENADPVFVQQCIDVIACARRTACATGPRGAEECYCGAAVTTDQCQAGTVMGLCKSEIEIAAGGPAGPPVTDAIQVAALFTNRTVPLGNAKFMLDCDRDFCASSCLP